MLRKGRDRKALGEGVGNHEVGAKRNKSHDTSRIQFSMVIASWITKCKHTRGSKASPGAVGAYPDVTTSAYNRFLKSPNVGDERIHMGSTLFGSVPSLCEFALSETNRLTFKNLR